MTGRGVASPVSADQPDADGLRLQILGPLRLWRAGEELDAGPPQQALLLAVLLARVGQPVGTAELIEAIWAEDPPRSALNAIHKYVGTLRHLLESGLAHRHTGLYLHGVAAPTSVRLGRKRSIWRPSALTRGVHASPWPSSSTSTHWTATSKP